jgi:hypothetical protein
MKINFYRIEKKKLDERGVITVDSKGILEGSLKIKDGKLEYKGTEDMALVSLIKKPYETILVKSIDENNEIDIERKIYSPGTKQHLEYLKSKCWQYGYVAEVER